MVVLMTSVLMTTLPCFVWLCYEVTSDLIVVMTLALVLAMVLALV
jgi:hypothetical protein